MNVPSSCLDQAEKTPEWDLQALRTHLVETANSARTASLSTQDERRFQGLCQRYRDRVHRLMPSVQ